MIANLGIGAVAGVKLDGVARDDGLTAGAAYRDAAGRGVDIDIADAAHAINRRGHGGRKIKRRAIPAGDDIDAPAAGVLNIGIDIDVALGKETQGMSAVPSDVGIGVDCKAVARRFRYIGGAQICRNAG